jgi:hypothetical protein
LQERLNRLAIDADDSGADIAEAGTDGGDFLESVVLRVVDERWPFPPHYALAPQPLAALDLLDSPDPVARRIGREVPAALPEASRRCSRAARPKPAR